MVEEEFKSYNISEDHPFINYLIYETKCM